MKKNIFLDVHTHKIFKHYSIDGNELDIIVNIKTNEVFLPVKSYAKIACKTTTDIYNRLNEYVMQCDNHLTVLPITDANGVVSEITVITERMFSEWIVKDEPELLPVLVLKGVREFIRCLIQINLVVRSYDLHTGVPIVVPYTDLQHGNNPDILE